MAGRFKLLERVLLDRYFTEPQIGRIVPRLHKNYYQEPECLGEVIDTWNSIMNSASFNTMEQDCIPRVAKPPKNSIIGNLKLDMNSILADVEPDLLLLDPKKLISRHKKIAGLNITKNMAEVWLILFNAPRGFYLQDWTELTKKIYYIEHNVIDFLYEKKEQKTMDVHPIVKSAAVTEADFDHIRTRFLFASRSGYKTLSHMFKVQTALEQPTLTDIILADNKTFLKKFAPFCSIEEYASFSNLIKECDIDEDDAYIFEKLAEVNAINHNT